MNQKYFYSANYVDLNRFKSFKNFVLGLTFAFGFTPCIGPVLGALLTLSSNKQTVSEGILLLSAYSLGLAIPFMGSLWAELYGVLNLGAVRSLLHAIGVISTAISPFLFGLFIILKSKALRMNYQKHKTWLWVLFYGYLFYAAIHAIFIFLAIGST